MKVLCLLIFLFTSSNIYSQKKDSIILYNQFRDYVEWLKKRENDLIIGDDNERYQMISYDKYIFDKPKHKLYLYTSYDLVWKDESGFSWLITIPYKKKKKIMFDGNYKSQ